MSPRSKLSPMVRDRIIAIMVPDIMRGFRVNREQAKLLLAQLPSTQRDALYAMRASAMGMRNRQIKVKP